MSLLFNLIVLTSLWCLGLRIVTNQGMGLYKIRRALTDENDIALIPLYDPLIVCEWCMPSIHGTIGYAFAFGLGLLDGTPWWRLLILYPLVVCGASLVCGLTWELHHFLNSLRGQPEIEDPDGEPT